MTGSRCRPGLSARRARWRTTGSTESGLLGETGFQGSASAGEADGNARSPASRTERPAGVVDRASIQGPQQLVEEAGGRHQRPLVQAFERHTHLASAKWRRWNGRAAAGRIRWRPGRRASCPGRGPGQDRAQPDRRRPRRSAPQRSALRRSWPTLRAPAGPWRSRRNRRVRRARVEIGTGRAQAVQQEQRLPRSAAAVFKKWCTHPSMVPTRSMADAAGSMNDVTGRECPGTRDSLVVEVPVSRAAGQAPIGFLQCVLREGG